MKKFIASVVILAAVSFAGCSGSPLALQIEPRSSWEASAPRPFKAHTPIRITVHHEGTVFNPEKESGAAHIKKVQTWGMSEARNWVDIPYHYLIDFDGVIYQGRDPYTVGETNTEYDPTGHLLISLLGNFMEQEVPEKQLNAMCRLIAYCTVKYNIPLETLSVHKDFAKTDCPGKNLDKYFRDSTVTRKVRELLK